MEKEIKLLMLFGTSFEDTEAIATLDILNRGGIKVITASLMDSLYVKSKCNILIATDVKIEEVNYEEFDGLIIPGGPASFKIMPNLEIVDTLINYFAKSNKLVASICAAPHLVGRLGYFKNLNYTVHPGFEDKIIGGTYLKECGVVRSENFITAKSMYYSIPFGLEIIKYFYGNEALEKTKMKAMGN